MGTILENCFQATCRQKTNKLRKKYIFFFGFFASFGLTKLKLFKGKAKRSVEISLISKLIIGSILENSFQATLISKTNVLSILTYILTRASNFTQTVLKFPQFCNS